MSTHEPAGKNVTHSTPPREGNHGRAKWVFIGFMALAAGLLIAEHRVHVLGALPWLILLACPLMHVFMHRGHSHGAHNHHEDERK
tara:strand:- start:579 stop:833 length:255 start_codon:yes stop_codon:yes gene_type:complete